MNPLLRKLHRTDDSILEDAMQQVYSRFLQRLPRFTAIDGGSAKGLHTFPLSQLSGCDLVIAVEAIGELAAWLAQDIQTYSTGRLVRVVHAALQEDAECKATSFMRNTGGIGGSAITPIPLLTEDVDFERVEVPATTLDAVAADRPSPVRFIKLDLEGGEWGAIRGAARLMAEDRPVICSEHSVFSPYVNGYTLEEYFALFAERGYQLFFFSGEPLDSHHPWGFPYMWAAPAEDAPLVQQLLFEETARQIATRSPCA